MTFPFNLYAVALGMAGFVTWSTLPLWRRICIRRGLVDDPGARKIHTEPMPLAGGLAVLTGLVLPMLVAAIVVFCFPGESQSPINYGVSKRALQWGTLLAGAIAITLLGLADDKVELGPFVKFGGQCLVALAVAASGIRITLFVHSALFSYVITVLWIVGIINAFNFMDNMNGLCAGLGMIAAWSFALIAGEAGQYLVAAMACLICGALAGFLPHNFPTARSFLGDSGSHLVGYLMAVLAILPHFYTRLNPHPLAVLKPLLVLAVPIADMASVCLIRARAGKPVYVGDTNHFSHRLVRAGCSKRRAVLILWLAAALGGWLADF